MAAHTSQTLQARVLDLLTDALTTGDLTLTAVMMDDWFYEGRAELIGALPNSVLDRYSTSVVINSASGLANPVNALLRVTRFDLVDEILCQRVSPALKHLSRNANSIHYATDRFPIMYEEKGKIFVVPDPSAAEYGTLYYPDTESDIDSTKTPVLALLNFPPEAVAPLLAYVANRSCLREATTNRRNAYTQFKGITTASTGDLALYIASLPDLTAYVEETADSTLQQPALGFTTGDYDVQLKAALAAAEKYMIDASAVDGFEDYLAAFDPELAAAAIAGTASQLQIASNLVAQHAKYLQEYQAVAAVKTSVPEMHLKQLQGRLALTSQYLQHASQAQAAAESFFKDFQRGVARLAND